MVQHMTVDPLEHHKDISYSNLLQTPLSGLKSTESKASSHSFTNSAISYVLHKKPIKIKPSSVHCSFKGHSILYPASPPPPTKYSSQSHVAFRKVNQVTCFILKRLLGTTTSIMISPDSPLASEIFSIKDPRPLTAHLHTHGPNSQPRVFFNDTTESSSKRDLELQDHNSDHNMTEVQTKDKTPESESKSSSKTIRTNSKKKKKKYFKRVLPGTTKSVNSKSDISFDTTQEKLNRSDSKRKTKRKKNTGTTPDKSSIPSMAKIEEPERKQKQGPENTERRLSIKIPERRLSCSRPSHENSPVHRPVLEMVHKTESTPSFSPASTKNSKEDVLRRRSLMDTGDEEKMKKLPGAPKRQVPMDLKFDNDDWTSDGEKIEIIRQTVSRDRARRLQDKEVRYSNLSISMPNTRESKRPSMFESTEAVNDEPAAKDSSNWLFECKNIWSESSPDPNTKPAPAAEARFKPRTNPVFFDVNPRVPPNQPNSKTNQRYMYSMTKCVPKKQNMRTVKEGSFVLMGNSKNFM